MEKITIKNWTKGSKKWRVIPCYARINEGTYGFSPVKSAFGGVLDFDAESWGEADRTSDATSRTTGWGEVLSHPIHGVDNWECPKLGVQILVEIWEYLVTCGCSYLSKILGNGGFHSHGATPKSLVNWELRFLDSQEFAVRGRPVGGTEMGIWPSVGGFLKWGNFPSFRLGFSMT